MSDQSEQKRQLRQKMSLLRKALPPLQFAPSLLNKLPPFQTSQIVAGYWPMAQEIDVRPFLFAALAQGKKCTLPVVVQQNAPLIFRQWQSGDALEEGLHRTVHPFEGQPILQPDLIFVPLLAFDHMGGRLGFGGGYYDRTLSTLESVRVGVAYDEQEVDSVPMDEFDQRLDWIVTPTQVIQCQHEIKRN